jgi:hypothetical protein
MPTSRPSPTHTSSSRKTTGKHPKEKPFEDGARKPTRARRDDTPEAKRQYDRMPKTHATRGTFGAVRKDRKGAR